MPRNQDPSALGLTITGAAAAVAVGWGEAAGFAGLAHAIAVARSATDQPGIAAAGGAAAVTAALNAVNQMLDDPLLSDAAGMIAGAVRTTTAALLSAATRRAHVRAQRSFGLRPPRRGRACNPRSR